MKNLRITDPAGRVVYKHRGPLTPEQVLSIIRVVQVRIKARAFREDSNGTM